MPVWSSSPLHIVTLTGQRAQPLVVDLRRGVPYVSENQSHERIVARASAGQAERREGILSTDPIDINYIRSPYGSTGWDLSEAIYQTDTEYDDAAEFEGYPAGVYNMLEVGADGSTARWGVRQTVPIPALAGEEWCFSYFARNDGTVKLKVGPYIDIYASSSYASTATALQSKAQDANFTRHSLGFTIPTGLTDVTLSPCMFVQHNDGSLPALFEAANFTGAMLNRGLEPLPYFDGAHGGHWLGGIVLGQSGWIV